MALPNFNSSSNNTDNMSSLKEGIRGESKNTFVKKDIQSAVRKSILDFTEEQNQDRVNEQREKLTRINESVKEKTQSEINPLLPLMNQVLQHFSGVESILDDILDVLKKMFLDMVRLANTQGVGEGISFERGVRQRRGRRRGGRRGRGKAGILGALGVGSMLGLSDNQQDIVDVGLLGADAVAGGAAGGAAKKGLSMFSRVLGAPLIARNVSL